METPGEPVRSCPYVDMRPILTSAHSTTAHCPAPICDLSQSTPAQAQARFEFAKDQLAWVPWPVEKGKDKVVAQIMPTDAGFGGGDVSCWEKCCSLQGGLCVSSAGWVWVGWGRGLGLVHLLASRDSKSPEQGRF